MGTGNRSTSRIPQQAVFDVVRPMIRIFKTFGVSEGSIRSVVDRACRQYSSNPSLGLQLERVPFAELADIGMVWSRDPEFIDEMGSPMKLRLRGDSHSFESLLEKAGVSTPPDLALDKLQALGSVQLCGRARYVRLVSNVLLAVKGRRFVAEPLLDSIRRFCETIEHNLCERPSVDQGRMERWAACSSLDADQFPEAQRFVRLSGQAFLDSVDEKLASCRTKGSKAGLRYGVGVYVFVDRELPKPSKRRRRFRSRHRRATS
jgi:hypothetical protein